MRMMMMMRMGRILLFVATAMAALHAPLVVAFSTPTTKKTSTTAGSNPQPGLTPSSNNNNNNDKNIPKVSPATGLANQFYTWRKHDNDDAANDAAKDDDPHDGFQIRYQTAGPVDGEPLLFVHGLFVNADHWRHALQYVSQQGYRVYALDLFGCGYSDKPDRDSDVAQRCNGERGRFFDDADSASKTKPSVLPNIELGTANGRATRICNVDLKHPLGSPYNFFTWGELLSDFTRDVIHSNDGKQQQQQQVTLVCNSIGTISSLQAVLDTPELFDGVFVVCPNFRELHSAEIPFSGVSMPVIRRVQSALRTYGQTAFDFLAKPETVKQILYEPYAVTSAVDDILVKVLLDPLLTPGASQVVFDTLSYSAGPLPEQQLQEMSNAAAVDHDNDSDNASQRTAHKPVWICYGHDDPWTPAARVEALTKYSVVEKVVGLPGVGHCPHDEAPELVHPLLMEFLQRLHPQHVNSNVNDDKDQQ